MPQRQAKTENPPKKILKKSKNAGASSGLSKFSKQ
jgi:hypothetical protein